MKVYERHVRRNKPTLVLTDDGWVEETGGPAVCDDCGFEAKTPAGLATHRRTHEQEE